MASAKENGEVQVKYKSPTGDMPKVLGIHTKLCGLVAPSSFNNLSAHALRIVPDNLGWANEDAEIQVWFESDAADTVESEESGLMMEIQLKNKKTGAVSEKILTFDNMTGFASADTVDVVCAAGVPVYLAKYTVPKGMIARVKPNGIFYCYLGDDTS